MEKFGKHGPKSKALRPGQLGALCSHFALFVCRGIYSEWPESVACQLLIFWTSPLVVTERARKTCLCTCLHSHQLCDGWGHWSGLPVHWLLATNVGTPWIKWFLVGVRSTWPTNPQTTPRGNLDFRWGYEGTGRVWNAFWPNCHQPVSSVVTGLTDSSWCGLDPHSAISIHARVLSFTYILWAIHNLPQISFSVWVG